MKKSAKELFSENLKRIRKQNNITQEKLAEKLEIDSGTISNIERGVSFPNPETIDRFAEFFNVQVSEFFISNNEIYISKTKVKEGIQNFIQTCIEPESSESSLKQIHSHSKRIDP